MNDCSGSLLRSFSNAVFGCLGIGSSPQDGRRSSIDDFDRVKSGIGYETLYDSEGCCVSLSPEVEGSETRLLFVADIKCLPFRITLEAKPFGLDAFADAESTDDILSFSMSPGFSIFLSVDAVPEAGRFPPSLSKPVGSMARANNRVVAHKE